MACVESLNGYTYFLVNHKMLSPLLGNPNFTLFDFKNTFTKQFTSAKMHLTNLVALCRLTACSQTLNTHDWRDASFLFIYLFI